MMEGNKIETEKKGRGIETEGEATGATHEMEQFSVLEETNENPETQTQPPTLRLSGPIWSCPNCGFTTHFDTLQQYKVGERRMALDIEEIQPTQRNHAMI